MKAKKKATLIKNEQTIVGYDDFLKEIIELFEKARHISVRAVNSVMTGFYWDVGRRIVLQEQGGKGKADYGKQIIDNLARDMTARFGRGFGRRNVFQMRAFYLNYQTISQTASTKSESGKTRPKVQTLSAQFDLVELTGCFPLP